MTHVKSEHEVTLLDKKHKEFLHQASMLTKEYEAFVKISREYRELAGDLIPRELRQSLPNVEDNINFLDGFPEVFPLTHRYDRKP